MAEYLQYTIRSLGPLRIADDSRSQSGQMATLCYIPGTTIRGLVIGRLANSEGFEFDSKKQELFSERTRFLNAYLSDGERYYIPSPKGFYEDKTEVEGKKELQNVTVCGELDGAVKRAALGQYSRLDLKEKDGCIYYRSLKIGSDLKINMGEHLSYEEKPLRKEETADVSDGKNADLEENQKMNQGKPGERTVFRNEYILPGYEFTGWIVLEEENEELLKSIKEVLSGEIRLGNARTAGAGRCEICFHEKSSKEIPYSEYLPTTDQADGCYMLLLSNLVLRGPDGELCGLEGASLKSLGEKLGVKALKITPCSTSVVSVRGYNRKLGGTTPSCPMYEQGSVFHLHYNGTITQDAMRMVADEGIGLHRNEGCGRVIFLDERIYEQVKFKDKETTLKSDEDNSAKKDSGSESHQNRSSETALNEDDKRSIETAARAWYHIRLQRAMQRYVVDFFKKEPEDKKEIKEKKSDADVFFQGASSSQIGAVESILSDNRYNANKAIDTLTRFTINALDKETTVNIQKQKSRSSGFASRVLAWMTKKSLEEILQKDNVSTIVVTADAEKVMGIDKSKLLSPEKRENPCEENTDPVGEIKSVNTDEMKIELILQLIRFRNKNE